MEDGPQQPPTPEQLAVKRREFIAETHQDLSYTLSGYLGLALRDVELFLSDTPDVVEQYPHLSREVLVENVLVGTVLEKIDAIQNSDQQQALGNIFQGILGSKDVIKDSEDLFANALIDQTVLHDELQYALIENRAHMLFFAFFSNDISALMQNFMHDFPNFLHIRSIPIPERLQLMYMQYMKEQAAMRDDPDNMTARATPPRMMPDGVLSTEEPIAGRTVFSDILDTAANSRAHGVDERFVTARLENDEDQQNLLVDQQFAEVARELELMLGAYPRLDTFFFELFGLDADGQLSEALRFERGE